MGLQCNVYCLTIYGPDHYDLCLMLYGSWFMVYG